MCACTLNHLEICSGLEIAIGIVGAVGVAISIIGLWVSKSKREVLLSDGIKLAEFKPHVYVYPDDLVTMALFEDVAYVSKPLHDGVYHFIDELRAVDDGRLVGVQFWVGSQTHHTDS